MNFKIIWFDEAVEELEKIYNYYYEKSPVAALKIYNCLLEEIKYLENHPKIASVEPILEDKEFVFRSFVVYKGIFKVIYYIDHETVVITRIWCCRKDPGFLNVE